MDIATVKAKMSEFFGKDDMYRMPLGVAVEDWLVAEHDRLSAALTSAKEEIDLWKRRWANFCDMMGEIGKEQNQGYRELTTLLVEQYDTMKTALASERKETERLRGLLRKTAPHLLMTEEEKQRNIAASIALDGYELDRGDGE